MSYKKLWISLAIVFIASFAVLGYYGGRLLYSEPPIPNKVVVTDGTVVFLRKIFKQDKMYGSPSAARNLEAYGGTELMLHPTGQLTGSIVNRCGYSTAGQ